MELTSGAWMLVGLSVVGITIYAFVDDWWTKRKSSRQ
jgi:hypothetical protein